MSDPYRLFVVLDAPHISDLEGLSTRLHDAERRACEVQIFDPEEISRHTLIIEHLPLETAARR